MYLNASPPKGYPTYHSAEMYDERCGHGTGVIRLGGASFDKASTASNSLPKLPVPTGLIF